MPAALLLTDSSDHYTVDRVSAALSQRGLSAVRIDTDLFPAQVQVRAAIDCDGGVEFTGRWGVIRGSEVAAVWVRRIHIPRPSAELDPRFEAMCRGETLAAWWGAVDGLAHARWVNDLYRAQRAENKLLQLRAAAACGLQVPATLVTNAPEQATRFHDEHRGAVVTKMLGRSAGPDGTRVYTSPVSRADLVDGATALRHAPILLQQRIAKQAELRVIYVAGQLWCAAVDASSSRHGVHDWRRATAGECAWSADTLPEAVRTGLGALMERLELVFGAIDLIRTPAGEHVFLEVNPAGEWGMLERDLGFPIAAAIANALAGTPAGCPAPSSGPAGGEAI